jgi:predicted kinase
VAESHTPIRPDHRRTVNNDDQEKVGWPIDTESEFRTEYGNATEPYTTETGTGDKQNGTEQESAMELAGKEWLQWVEESSATEKRLMILRGLPGSGKSTLARELAGKDGIIFSTDDLFYINGRYVFDRSKLGEYHERNRENARQAMLIEISPVVIDNTNTTAWEMKPYVELAQSLGYEVAILEPSTPWKFDCAELARRNSHGVPHDKIERMLERYEHHITVESILASQPPNKDRYMYVFKCRFCVVLIVSSMFCILHFKSKCVYSCGG